MAAIALVDLGRTLALTAEHLISRIVQMSFPLENDFPVENPLTEHQQEGTISCKGHQLNDYWSAGMRVSALRGLLSGALIVLFPFSSWAADSNAAMLYTNGAAWINGAHIPRSSSAIFSGDLVQTRSDSIANINEPGSTILVLSDSLVQFDAASMRIEHGGVTVSTSKGVATTAGDVKVYPASNSWTEFNVVDLDGTVRIAARKGDLMISDGKETVTLTQGQETTRDETSDTDNNGKKRKRKGTPGSGIPAATGGILNTPVAIGIAGGAVIGITTWVLVKSDDPASPTKP